jgi:hypothetical protein
MLTELAGVPITLSELEVGPALTHHLTSNARQPDVQSIYI